MPSKIEFEFQAARHNTTDKLYIIESIMRHNDDLEWAETTFGEDDILDTNATEQRICIDFNSSNKKLSGIYIMVYNIDDETVKIYRKDKNGKEYLIDPANYDVDINRWRGDADDPAWKLLGYEDTDSENEDDYTQKKCNSCNQMTSCGNYDEDRKWFCENCIKV